MQNKRFIAGAHCPSCGKIDTLRWWQENNHDLFDCVDCGFSETHFVEDNKNMQPESKQKQNVSLNHGQIINVVNIES